MNDVITALNYNIKNGGGDPSRTAVYNHNIKIAIAYSKEGSYHNAQGGVLWNSELGSKYENTIVSPATILDHELDHAIQYKIKYRQWIEDRANNDVNYGNAEEKRVITGSEQKTADAKKKINYMKLIKRNLDKIIVCSILSLLLILISKNTNGQTILDSSQIDSIQFIYIYKYIDFSISQDTEEKFMSNNIELLTLKNKKKINKFVKIVNSLESSESNLKDYRVFMLINLKNGKTVKLAYSYLYCNGVLDDNGTMKTGNRRLHRFFDNLLYGNYISPVPKITKKMIRKENNN